MTASADGHRLGSQIGAERFAIGLRWVLPLSPDRVPAFAESLLVSVAILGDDRRDPLPGDLAIRHSEPVGPICRRASLSRAVNRSNVARQEGHGYELPTSAALSLE
jgi:hypothetical protein